MLTFSLMLSIVVLVLVAASLLVGAAWTRDAYGPATPAQGILLAIYLAILLLSVAILVTGPTQHAPAMLALQVIYKVLTLPLVGPRNPVVLSNLGIALVHAFTLVSPWQAGSL